MDFPPLQTYHLESIKENANDIGLECIDNKINTGLKDTLR